MKTIIKDVAILTQNITKIGDMEEYREEYFDFLLL